jgi:hypothetical protein
MVRWGRKSVSCGSSVCGTSGWPAERDDVIADDPFGLLREQWACRKVDDFCHFVGYSRQ